MDGVTLPVGGKIEPEAVLLVHINGIGLLCRSRSGSDDGLRRGFRTRRKDEHGCQHREGWTRVGGFEVYASRKSHAFLSVGEMPCLKAIETRQST
jgi:hypothetical protein